MKFSVSQVFLVLILGAILLSVSGCATDDPENTSVRPWNQPQSWEGGIPLMDTQHR
jgi:hypothetical protein